MVAVLSRYITGRGRPGTGTLILVAGLALNIGANLVLIPAYGIRGAAAASSLSYFVTAALTLVVFHRLSGPRLARDPGHPADPTSWRWWPRTRA